MSYIKTGKCEDRKCSLNHIKDVSTLEKGTKINPVDEPATNPFMPSKETLSAIAKKNLEAFAKSKN